MASQLGEGSTFTVTLPVGLTTYRRAGEAEAGWRDGWSWRSCWAVVGGRVLRACGPADRPAAHRATADVAGVAHRARPWTPAPRGTGPASRDGTLRSAAYGRGSERPPWLYERELPERPDGYGVVRPTPPELRRRAFTLPDTVPMLPGRGYASRIVSPAPAPVVDRSTWEPGCPVGPRRAGVAAADLPGVRRAAPHRRAAGARPRRAPTSTRCSGGCGRPGSRWSRW